MTAYLLDTNHVGLAVRHRSNVSLRIRNMRQLGHRLGTCLPVLCEIEAGRRLVSHPVQYRRNLDQLLKQLRIWPMDMRTTFHYGDIRDRLRSAGQAMSPIDMMAAALARQMNLVVVTTDHDFQLLPDIKTEDWTT